MGMDRDESDELQRVVGDLRDREAIRDLAVRYAHAVDSRDLDALVVLFVQDVDAGHRGRGRLALRSLFDDVLRTFTTSIHFVGNHLIEIDGDDASGAVYCRFEHERDDRWIVQTMQYHDRYARRDGRWFFVSRNALPWYATEHLDPPAGSRKIRFPDRATEHAPLPGTVWPSWDRFWGHAGGSDLTPARTVRIPGAGLELTADIRGDEGNPVVLLLHGGGQTRHSWGTTAHALARHGWCAIAIDARGHGDSDWSPDGQYGFDRFTADVLAVASRYDRPALVGASLGGVSSMLAIGRSAEPFASALVLVDVAHRLNPLGTLRIGEFMRGSPEGFASMEEAADAVASYIPHRPRPRNLSGLQKNLRQREDGRWVWHWDPRFLRPVDEAPDLTAYYPTAELIAATARIRDLQLPTMLVRGRMSDVVNEEHALELQDLIPHAKVVDVAGAGHMMAGDSNDLFNEAIIDFLGSAAAPIRPPEEIPPT